MVRKFRLHIPMGRKKDLTKEECHTIKILKKEGMSSAKIAWIIGRSATAVKNCLNRWKLTSNTDYLKRKNSGRKSIVDKRFGRRILREIKADPSMRKMPKHTITAEISRRIQVPMSTRTLMRAFERNQ